MTLTLSNPNIVAYPHVLKDFGLENVGCVELLIREEYLFRVVDPTN